jgi:hypothetical protein
MADFQQNVVPTFTRLVDEDLGRMEKRILRAARDVPIGVIIPALFNDLSSPAHAAHHRAIGWDEFRKSASTSASPAARRKSFSGGERSSNQSKTAVSCFGTTRQPSNSYWRRSIKLSRSALVGREAPCGPRWAMRWAKAKSLCSRFTMRTS